MSTIYDLEPKAFFYWFAEIMKIPRCSGNEKQISDFLMQFAKERKLEAYQDEALNVIIKKPGTAGYEKSPVLIIQGHMDMVCEKTPDSPHNFCTDPIKPVIKSDFMYADNTTLGGDDGVAVAYGLAILDSDTLAHPPIEVFITTDEEEGMTGIMNFDASLLQGKQLLNIDSEEEGIFLVSCAGGANTLCTFDIQEQQAKGKFLKLNIEGLLGGHSGIEIIKQRANAIKILGRVLYKIAQTEKITLATITGGSKHNAIAKYAEAVIAAENPESVISIVKSFTEELQKEYRASDKDLSVKISETPALSKMYTNELSENLIDFMMMVPDGVQYMNLEIPGMVKTSLNNGVLEQKDGQLQFTLSVRSSAESSSEEILSVIEACTKRCKGNFSINSIYPPWEYEPKSVLRDTAVKTYKEVTGKEPLIEAIHAGLECGIIKKAIPGLDALSIGPNLYDVHTPDEHLSISSVKRTWDFLVKLLENLK
ncbi:aminoacyl-histidine dipeptidase [Treponema phagedenis]|uniref:Cytosol non-specific dipeptidase n=1 Tax=Treponema phagedenis TaxID=162 RepID=A0A0B7GWJ3_TREPH|nr:aminoacyl-histidine dipeptidase [Treponema phagedenis]QSH94841.1 aminoacyl-histidine dipeptidase [Treponema phagedenis]QSI00401.1 aminoacyl-histidine dipeptidase [Treponema phagedenis]CEM61937.1 Xaa-His dipeptidase [Treponema phagedenis]